MSATTTQTTIPITNGNGHTATRKARGPNKKTAKAKVQTKAATPAATAAAPIAATQATMAKPSMLSIAWLREREMQLETESRIAAGRLAEVRTLIAGATRYAQAPRKMTRAKGKKAARKTAPANIAA